MMLRLPTLAPKASRPLSRALHASAPSSFLVRSLEDVQQSRRVITSDDGALETRYVPSVFVCRKETQE